MADTYVPKEGHIVRRTDWVKTEPNATVVTLSETMVIVHLGDPNKELAYPLDDQWVRVPLPPEPVKVRTRVGEPSVVLMWVDNDGLHYEVKPTGA